MKFMDWLNEGLAKTVINDALCVQEPMSTGDDEDGDVDVQTVVLTEELKQLFCFSESVRLEVLALARRADYSAVDLRHGGGEPSKDIREKHDQLCLELERLNERFSLLRDIFWHAVKSEFPDLRKKSLFLCADWKLVAKDPDPPSILDHLLGVGGLTLQIPRRRGR